MSSPEPISDVTFDELAELLAGTLYICTQCKARSRHPDDVADMYCSRCHRFELDYEIDGWS